MKITPEIRSKLSDRKLTIFENLATLRKAEKSFLAVGQALMEVRDWKLFRADGQRNFSDWCREVYDLSPGYASRLIQAYQVGEKLPRAKKPRSEKQARALAKADPDLQEAVMDAAGEQPTTGRIEELIEKAKAAQDPEEQRRLLEEERQRNLAHQEDHSAPRQFGGCNHQARLDRGIRRLKAARKDFDAVGPETEQLILIIDSALAEAAQVKLQLS